MSNLTSVFWCHLVFHVSQTPRLFNQVYVLLLHVDNTHACRNACKRLCITENSKFNRPEPNLQNWTPTPMYLKTLNITRT